jgi:hypothetical protein
MLQLVALEKKRLAMESPQRLITPYPVPMGYVHATIALSNPAGRA